MEDFGFLIKKVSRGLTGYQDRLLKHCNIRSTQLHVLIVVSENKGKTSSEMANILCMDRTTFTRNLSPLINHGYVTLFDGYTNLKKKHYVLTKQGMDIVKRGVPILNAANVKLQAYMSSASDVDLFSTCCQSIFDYLDEVQRVCDEV